MVLDEIRILVVEDDADLAGSSARVLDQAGYGTRVALSGEAAWQLLGDFRPDLVLLDRDLPDLDGIGLCRRIKGDPELAQVFVVMLSGTHTHGDEQISGLESGADGYLVTPALPEHARSSVSGLAEPAARAGSAHRLGGGPRAP